MISSDCSALEARIYDYKPAIEISAGGEAQCHSFNSAALCQELADPWQTSAIESN
jgi:hypothetical protein